MNIVLQVPNIRTEMLHPDFWLSQTAEPDAVLLNADEIDVFNRRAYERLNIPTVFDVLSDETAIREKMASYIPAHPLYSGTGEILDAPYYARMLESAVVPGTVQFGLVIRRTHVRAFPTHDIATPERFELKTDLFQETTIDVGWPVAVLATSGDGRWCFCLTSLVWGWVLRRSLVFAEKDQIIGYLTSDEMIVTTASRGLVGLHHGGGITPQMGSTLPLADFTDDVYRVRIPSAVQDRLQIEEGYIYRENPQFRRGFLPCTPRSLLTMAFSMLGEHYAWGGSRLGIFGRDCSRYVKDIYATTGVTLPRNSRQQTIACTPVITFDESADVNNRKAAIVAAAQPGDLIHLPGHIMMYLGHVDGEPYVIHDAGGAYMRVIVSDLDLYAESPKGALVMRLSQVVRVR